MLCASSVPDFTMSQQIKDRTLVFTLPKRIKVKPLDFLPALFDCDGLLEGFGTVGVSHIWHATFRDLATYDLVLSRGSFTILEGVHVVVSKLGDGFHVGQLHWIPYWVPHSDIERSLSILLGDKVSCTYIRIPQKGFTDCYSTQRSITSPADLIKLPYFINVISEGITYKSCLFIPGRVQVCFNCHLTGHMRSDCLANKMTQPIADLPVQPVPAQKPESKATDEDKSSESSKSSEEVEMQEDPPRPSYQILMRGGKSLKFKGADSIVTPPDHSSVTQTDLDAFNSKCDHYKACGYVSPWMRGLISHNRLNSHFIQAHDMDFYLVGC